MADALKQYWFVAAVFHAVHDLVATLAELHENGFARDRLLVLANHRCEDARKAVVGSQVGPVPVVALHADGAIKPEAVAKLPAELRTLLGTIDESRSFDGAKDGKARPDGGGNSQVYAQLRQDIAGGAVVLIASVVDPEEQLLGARILLRGNCECVLTHEITA